MTVNKVDLADGTTLIDITDTTAEAADVAAGKVFYTAAGVRAVGTNAGSDPLDAWPIGSIYQSTDPTSPEVLFGGYWEPIKGRFLLAAAEDEDIGTEPDDSVCYRTAGATGGSERVTLTTDQIPAHTHGSKTLTGTVTTRALDGGSTENKYHAASGIVSRSKNSAVESWYTTSGRTTISGGAYNKITVTATHEHNSVGGGQSHGNMPPYLAVYMWVRVAAPEATE